MVTAPVLSFALSHAKNLLYRRRLRNTPKAALSRVVLRNRVFQIGASEIRPHSLGEQQLGVGALPRKEIAQPLLAAGPNQQVDIGRVPQQPGELLTRRPLT